MPTLCATCFRPALYQTVQRRRNGFSAEVTAIAGYACAHHGLHFALSHGLTLPNREAEALPNREAASTP